MFSQFHKRSDKLEHLDKGDYTPEEYEGCLVELRRVNAWLGDTRALRETLYADIERLNLAKFSVLDVGAGSGELLRATDRWAKQHNRQSKLVGVELNARSARAISEESRNHPAIRAVQADGFKLPFVDHTFDYVICSLITHHFSDVGVVSFLREMNRIARKAIFAIDLHRNALAYYFYITIGRLLFRNRLIREDGALSILRSFKPEELESLAHQAQLKDVEVLQTFPSRLVLSARPRSINAADAMLHTSSIPAKVTTGVALHKESAP